MLALRFAGEILYKLIKWESHTILCVTLDYNTVAVSVRSDRVVIWPIYSSDGNTHARFLAIVPDSKRQHVGSKSCHFFWFRLHCASGMCLMDSDELACIAGRESKKTVRSIGELRVFEPRLPSGYPEKSSDVPPKWDAFLLQNNASCQLQSEK